MQLGAALVVHAHSLALAVPALVAAAALLRPRSAPVATGVALGLAILVGVLTALGAGGSALGVRLDLLSCVMLLLVCGIGALIARYSRSYLGGEARASSYFRWLLLTLAAVTTLVTASHLLLIALAWTATSVALHQLLTFFPDRQAALVAAHKKFLVSRAADVCFWSALGLVWLSVGSLDLDRLDAWVAEQRGLTPGMQMAAVLTVLAVALKSAQLPFHGWLTQVMEAPTPVSALLHAGVVNIGGFVMIRLAPWMAEAEIARLLLVVVGLVTTVVGALVMTTRISVKVSLAWSTIAQMGFMLVQCGLGAWHLALLHLVAHSLYKAHAFLGSGTVVESWRREQLSAPVARPSVPRFALTTLVVLGVAAIAVVGVPRAIAPDASASIATWVLGLGVALGLVPMFARAPVASAAVGRVASATLIVALYVAWHVGVSQLLPTVAEESLATELGWWLAGGGFVTLFALRSLLELRAAAQPSRSLYQWLFMGLYLDERFTRLTFRLWPPRLERSLGVPAVALEPATEAAS